MYYFAVHVRSSKFSLVCFILVDQRSLSPSVKLISSLFCSVVILCTVANLGLGARRLNTLNSARSF